jgi:hypothetical protein
LLLNPGARTRAAITATTAAIAIRNLLTIMISAVLT